MEWVAGGHDGDVSVDPLIDDLEEWFGRYLKHDAGAADTAFSVLVPETSLLGENRGTRDPETLIAQSYPGRGSNLMQQRAHPVWTAPEHSGAARWGARGPDQPSGNRRRCRTSIECSRLHALGVLPGQSARFTSEPLMSPLTLIGSSRIDLDVTATTRQATLFASLCGSRTRHFTHRRRSHERWSEFCGTPQLAVAPVKLTGLDPDKTQHVTIALPAVSHKVPVGHRLQLCCLYDGPGVRECRAGCELHA